LRAEVDRDRTVEAGNGSAETRSSWSKIDAIVSWFARFYARPALWRVAFGVAAAVLAALARLALMGVLGQQLTYLTFYPAVEISALIGGLPSGVAATFASALFAHGWLRPIQGAADLMGLAIFLSMALIMSLITEVLHQNWVRLASAEARFRSLEEKFQIVKHTSASIAHEINQPLTAAQIFLQSSQQLLDMEPEQRPGSIARTLAQAASQVSRAGEMLNRLRKFIARNEPEKLLVELHQIVRQAYDQTNAKALEFGIDFTLQLNAEKDRIFADPEQIRLVLVNLIRNAKDATSNVDRREIVVLTSSSETHIRVDIADTGVGLIEPLRSNRFTPFESTKPGGMGLGLVVSRAIIEDHDGQLTASSNADGGATLSITLPLA
jgi:signal transduction histidine kinase